MLDKILIAKSMYNYRNYNYSISIFLTSNILIDTLKLLIFITS